MLYMLQRLVFNPPLLLSVKPYFEHLFLGELNTLAVLDRERETEYDLVVKATDGGGRSCQTDVILLVQDMNDNPPQFSTSQYEITVFDNTTIRTPIAVIYAKDPDTGMVLLLLSRMAALKQKTQIIFRLIYSESIKSPQVFSLTHCTQVEILKVCIA